MKAYLKEGRRGQVENHEEIIAGRLFCVKYIIVNGVTGTRNRSTRPLPSGIRKVRSHFRGQGMHIARGRLKPTCIGGWSKQRVLPAGREKDNKGWSTSPVHEPTEHPK